MKWIVVAILACIIPYTWLTLQFRKENPSYQPYHDTKERAQVKRLLEAEVRRVHLEAEPATAAPVLPASDHAPTQSAAGGLPEHLREVLLDEPNLPIAVNAVRAAAVARATAHYPIHFSVSQRDARERLVRVAAYLSERNLTLVPQYNEHQGSASRTAEVAWQVTLPPGLLKPGSYEVTLAGDRASRRWGVDVGE